MSHKAIIALVLLAATAAIFSFAPQITSNLKDNSDV